MTEAMNGDGWDEPTGETSSPLSLQTRVRYLVCQTGSRRGEWVRLVERRTLLGRARTATVHFDDESVSRDHAEIRVDGDHVTLTDLGSRNGTFCNEKPVIKSCELHRGDHVRLGKDVILYFVERDDLALTPPVADFGVAGMQEELSRRRRSHTTEVQTVQRIQRRLLPDCVDVPGLQLAARMLPSDEVGGDYYEIIPIDDGCLIGIGDVAGHGLQPGLISLMIQSCVATLARQTPNASPITFVSAVNELLYGNVRERARQDEHATFSLLRYKPDGSVCCAGAHEEHLVWRRRTGRCERFETHGPFLGASRDIERALVEQTIVLEPGDVLVLYSDGITEALGVKSRDRFEVHRLCEVVEANAGLPVDRLRDKVLDDVLAYCGGKRDDDMTLLLARYAV